MYVKGSRALERKKSPLIVVLMVFVVIVATIISSILGFLVGYNVTSSSVRESRDYERTPISRDEKEDEVATKGDTEIREIEKNDSSTQSNSGQEDEVFAEFSINEHTIADYYSILDPNTYDFYNSGITDFNFFYPSDFFNHVSRDTSNSESMYGNNIETISFEGSDGSKLVFSLYERTDNMSLEEATNYYYSIAESSFVEPSKIKSDVSDGHGKNIIAGLIEDGGQRYRLYDMTKIESNYVLKMLALSKEYTSEEDRLLHAYVIENYYRMCGFSDSTKRPRSYEEYLEDNQ